MITPREFDAEFVKPAVSMWIVHHSTPHFAIHAISQFDVLAEVTARWGLLASHQDASDLGRVAQYRTEQGIRERALAVVRAIHETHKHGRLWRTNEALGARLQGAGAVPYAEFCVEASGPNAIKSLHIKMDNGSSTTILNILIAARSAWEREFSRLKL